MHFVAIASIVYAYQHDTWKLLFLALVCLVMLDLLATAFPPRKLDA